MVFEKFKFAMFLSSSLCLLSKTPSFIPGQRCPENLEIFIITDVQFSNFNNSEVAEDIKSFFHILKI